MWSRPGEWGINAHVMGVGMGHGQNGSAGMVGAGAGLRYRLSPAFALESNFDLAGGTDYNGNSRTEEALSFNGLIFVNPRHRVQYYFLGGLGWGWAHVSGPDMPTGISSGAPNLSPGSFTSTADYKYFGGQIGFGSEFRITPSWALNGDIRGFIRSRIDVPAGSAPEYQNADTGQSTNTSGGVIFTLGTTFYF